VKRRLVACVLVSRSCLLFSNLASLVERNWKYLQVSASRPKNVICSHDLERVVVKPLRAFCANHDVIVEDKGSAEEAEFATRLPIEGLHAAKMYEM
jgi:hypothetical protein